MIHEKYYQAFLQKNPYPRKLKHYDTQTLLNFASSDYLGLAKHPLLIARSQEYAKRWGVGVGASRLVCGNFAIYENIENSLAEALRKPAAIIFGSGYQANNTMLEALLDKRVLGKNKPHVFCDRHCHASMLNMAKDVFLHRFRHQDYEHLNSLLEKFADDEQPNFILIESLYSMDGDITNLAQIRAIAKKYNAFLYVDDAHAVGVYGEAGWGFAPTYATDVDIIMGTFSKALGSFGGYAGCSTVLRDYLINKCKGFIYSTGLSPAVLGAIAGAIELMPQLSFARQNLIKRAEQLHQFFQKHAVNSGTSTTHIIPWIIGDAQRTELAAQYLAQEGILATAIRPPSVAMNACRIRFCVSAEHSEEDIEKLQNAILKVRETLGFVA